MRAALSALLALSLGACVAPAPPAETGQPACVAGAVVDGDTFRLACSGQPERLVRLQGIDAPEIARAMCPAERAAGARSRQALEALLRSGPITGIRYGDRLSDGRQAATVELGGRDLGALLVAQGAARTVDGGYVDWCAGG